VMTRTTFKALWVSGGGVLATWLAVSPAPNNIAATSPSAAARGAAAQTHATAEELNAQATRLRERTTALALRPSTRNPFAFNAPKSAPRESTTRETAEAPAFAPAMPVSIVPALKLAGVAQKAGKRTAIISSEGQIYLVGEGDSVAGLYTVVKVDADAVHLLDIAGIEQRLVLPQ
jgi:Tfp pilus assembly protein PilP